MHGAGVRKIDPGGRPRPINYHESLNDGPVCLIDISILHQFATSRINLIFFIIQTGTGVIITSQTENLECFGCIGWLITGRRHRRRITQPLSSAMAQVHAVTNAILIKQE
jgi:hypothetical protein